MGPGDRNADQTRSAGLADAEVPGVWQALGLPGLIDVHVHFMPRAVMDKVWAYFDAAGPLVGRAWPILYRAEEEVRLAQLADLGVLTFPSLVYAHKPGMSAWLNAWAAGFAGQHPQVLRTATFFPEPEAAGYVEDALRDGARVFKAHLQVGGYDPRDPLLAEVWGSLADSRVPVIVHCGSGPVPGAFTGPGPMAEVLARHPDLTAVIAHMGGPEYEDFLDLALRYPRVHLDTTMAFTDFMEAAHPFPRHRLGSLADLGPRILLGSDFPNTPYPYAHQIEALVRIAHAEDAPPGLGDAWLRQVMHDNAKQLLSSSAV